MSLAIKESCSGCGACKVICSQNAITYNLDDDGFQVPIVDNTKCVNCGLCNRICPAIQLPHMNPVIQTFAAQAKDTKLLIDSTSGALFPVFALEIIRNNGTVYGCVWDKNYNAIFERATCEKDIIPMKGSKYVWSYAGDSFPKVKYDLDSGKTVLFAGLPCQVAGLKGYLRKEYDKLIIIDFLCSGAPSPLAFHRYLDTIVSREQYGDLNFKFRDKKPYGVGVHITYNGQRRKTSFRGEHIKNPYYYAFYRHYLDRLSCYTCPYGSNNRVSDVTLGDYWGVEKYHADMDIRSGVSTLLVNSEKGIRLVQSLSDKLVLIPTKIENICKTNNLSLTEQRRNRKIPDDRKYLFQEIRENGWSAAEKKYLYSFDRLKERIKLLVPLWLVHIVNKHLKR